MILSNYINLPSKKISIIMTISMKVLTVPIIYLKTFLLINLSSKYDHFELISCMESWSRSSSKSSLRCKSIRIYASFRCLYTFTWIVKCFNFILWLWTSTTSLSLSQSGAPKINSFFISVSLVKWYGGVFRQ